MDRMGNGGNSGGRLDGNRLASLSREKMLSTSPYLKEWLGPNSVEDEGCC